MPSSAIGCGHKPRAFNNFWSLFTSSPLDPCFKILLCGRWGFLSGSLQSSCGAQIASLDEVVYAPPPMPVKINRSRTGIKIPKCCLGGGGGGGGGGGVGFGLHSSEIVPVQTFSDILSLLILLSVFWNFDDCLRVRNQVFGMELSNLDRPGFWQQSTDILQYKWLYCKISDRASKILLLFGSYKAHNYFASNSNCQHYQVSRQWVIANVIIRR